MHRPLFTSTAYASYTYIQCTMVSEQSLIHIWGKYLARWYRVTCVGGQLAWVSIFWLHHLQAIFGVIHCVICNPIGCFHLKLPRRRKEGWSDGNCSSIDPPDMVAVAGENAPPLAKGLSPNLKKNMPEQCFDFVTEEEQAVAVPLDS